VFQKRGGFLTFEAIGGVWQGVLGHRAQRKSNDFGSELFETFDLPPDERMADGGVLIHQVSDAHGASLVQLVTVGRSGWGVRSPVAAPGAT